MPQEELFAVVKGERLGDAGKCLLVHGLENLVLALAEVMGVGEDGEYQPRH